MEYSQKVRLSFLVRLFEGSIPSIPIFEKMAEWLKAVDCKSIGISYIGSNPIFFIFIIMFFYFYYSNLFVLSIFFFLSVCLAIIFFCASFFLSGQNPDSEKLSPYECGFDPYGDARNSFDVRFYIVGLLFLVFDVETVFIFPWVASCSGLSISAFWGMTDFILELLVGFYFVWVIGVLDWE